MSRVPDDLNRLNEPERRVLRLLAQGHTAKSIATAMGSTPAAVYERLREARRKTGVGSSRELARLMRAQEIGHEQLGLDSSQRTTSVDSTSDAPARSNRKVHIAMMGLLLTGLFAATLTMQSSERSDRVQDAGPFSDPILGDIFAPKDPAKVAELPTTERDYVHPKAASSAETEAELRRLHAQVRTQPREGQAETKLAAIYKSIHPIKLSSAPLRVICSASLCEVATTTQPHSPQAELDATLGEVQGVQLRHQAEAMGLKPLYLFFGLHPNGDRAAYLGYWSRSR